MAEIKANIKIDTKDFERKLILAVQKRIRKFISLFAGKIQDLVNSINDIIESSDVGKFIRNGGGGQLGIIDADAIMSRLQGAMKDSSKRPILQGSPTAGVLRFEIGDKDALRAATLFAWTNSQGSGVDVNLFSLIEDGDISGTGWSGFGNKDHSFRGLSELSPRERRLSRTGKGLMVDVRSSGKQAYSLPTKHIEGFSRAVLKSRGEALKSLLIKLMNEAAREAGFTKTKG